MKPDPKANEERQRKLDAALGYKEPPRPAYTTAAMRKAASDRRRQDAADRRARPR